MIWHIDECKRAEDMAEERIRKSLSGLLHVRAMM